MDRPLVLARVVWFAGTLTLIGLAYGQTYSLTEIGTFGRGTGFSTAGAAINEFGEAVGTLDFGITSGAEAGAFIYRNGTARLLDGTDGGIAINNAGQVTAWLDSYPFVHALLYSHGTLKDLGSLGGTYTLGVAMNHHGEVTGDSSTADNAADHAFLYSHGTMQDLGTLGGSNSGGAAINRRGQVTGGSNTVDDAGYHAFLYTSGSMVDLGTFGGIYSSGSAINDRGQVTGSAYTAGNATSHAFLYSYGTLQDLGTLGGSNSGGTAINDHGQVAGGADIVGDAALHAFLYSQGEMHDLGTLGGTDSFAVAINNAGQVLGQANIAGDTSYHPFLYTNGRIFDLNDLIDEGSPLKPYVTLTEAVGITDTGYILANGHNSQSGIDSAYVLQACRRDDDRRHPHRCKQ